MNIIMECYSIFRCKTPCVPPSRQDQFVHYNWGVISFVLGFTIPKIFLEEILNGNPPFPPGSNQNFMGQVKVFFLLLVVGKT